MIGVADESYYLFPNSALALFPGLYAWQVYGWMAGAAFYVVTFLLLVAAINVFGLAGWSYRWLVRTRTALILFAMAAIGLSAAQTCQIGGGCEWVFWP